MRKIDKKILETLEDGPKTTAEIAEIIEVNEKRTLRRLKSLEKYDDVKKEQVKKGKWHMYSYFWRKKP